MEVDLSEVNLENVVRDTLTGFEGQLGDRPIRLSFKGPQVPVHLVTDLLKLKQILINLVGNALKFTEKGQVTVTLRTDPESGKPTRLEIEDSGIGVPPDRLAAVFEAFEQVDSGTNRRHGGTGLGLTITKALCAEMGYRIEVESEVGKGSTFAVVFESGLLGASVTAPKTTPDPARLTRPAAPAPLDSYGDAPLVLVVDDEEDARFLVVNMLTELGYRTLPTSSGARALELARSARPSIITLDLLLGDVSGMATLLALKRDPELRDVPVFVISIVANDLSSELGGAAEILQKPLDREVLAEALNRHVGFPVPA